MSEQRPRRRRCDYTATLPLWSRTTVNSRRPQQVCVRVCETSSTTRSGEAWRFHRLDRRPDCRNRHRRREIRMILENLASKTKKPKQEQLNQIEAAIERLGATPRRRKANVTRTFSAKVQTRMAAAIEAVLERPEDSGWSGMMGPLLRFWGDPIESNGDSVEFTDAIIPWLADILAGGAVVMDIETAPIPMIAVQMGEEARASAAVGNLKDPEKIKAKQDACADAAMADAALSPRSGHITCASFCGPRGTCPLCLVAPHDDFVAWGHTMIRMNETRLIACALRLLDELHHWIGEICDERLRLITYNGDGFDIPFLSRRFIAHLSAYENLSEAEKCLHPPAWPEISQLREWNKDTSIVSLDIMKVMATRYNDFVPLNELLGFIGRSKPADGRKAIVMFEDKDYAGLARYCNSDVENEAAAYVDAVLALRPLLTR